VCTEIQIRIVNGHTKAAADRTRSTDEQPDAATGSDADCSTRCPCRSAVWRRGRR